MTGKLILITLLLLCSPAYAGYDVLRDTLQPGESMAAIRNHANLWQGYVHREDGTRTFHALVEDGEITYWHEYRANDDVDAAERGQVADLLTTSLALGLGFAESNPLGVLIVPGKIISNEIAEGQEYFSCIESKKFMAAMGYGAAAANMTTMAMGSFGPLSVIAWAVTAINMRDKGGHCEPWVSGIVRGGLSG